MNGKLPIMQFAKTIWNENQLFVHLDFCKYQNVLSF